jgi:DNA-binding IclR family transcriptional regulator
MMEMITNAWAAQAITTAADLGIADALEDGPLSIDESAAAVGADADTVGRRLRALIGRGLFRQRRDGRYDLRLLGRAGFRMTRVVPTASPLSVVEAIAV